MAIERSLIILKPDAVRRGVEFEILDRFKKKGFTVVGLYKASPSEDLLREHYAQVIADKGDKIGDAIIEFMRSGPMVVAVLEGNNAVEAVRAMGGAETQPIKCAPGTIRHDFSTDSYQLADTQGRSVENIIHSSDSKESAEREIELWFNKYAPKAIARLGLAATKPDVFEEIAGAMDYTTADLVKQIVEVSNAMKILYHGIKNPGDVEKIKQEKMLRPLTPEAGPGSCWSTGLSLFHPAVNSPFFCYSGGTHPQQPDVCELNLAMTSHPRLSDIGLHVSKYENDSTVDVKQAMPFEAMTVLNVKVKHPPSDGHKNLRKYRQMAEQLLLRAIDAQILCGNFSLGKVVGYHMEVQ